MKHSYEINFLDELIEIYFSDLAMAINVAKNFSTAKNKVVQITNRKNQRIVVLVYNDQVFVEG